MANFFLDNEDIQFLLKHIDVRELARIQEDDFLDTAPRPDYAPRDVEEAVDNYRRVLEIVGQVAGGHDRAQRRGRGCRGQHAERGRHGHVPPQGRREPEAAGASRPDGLYAALQVRRAELPESDLHGGHGDRQPGGRFADEPVRAAGDRRDGQRVCQRRDQGRSPAAVRARRSDRGDGADGARRGQRPAVRAAEGRLGRERRLAAERRQAVHHQRLRRDPADAGPQRAPHQRRPRA